MQITNNTTIAELALHPNPIISRHALGILKEARRQRDNGIKCNKCGFEYQEDDLVPIEDMRACRNCKTDAYLMDLN